MLKKLAALSILPVAAALLLLGFVVTIQRAPAPSDAARQMAQADFLLMTTPSVLLYLLSMPLVWRRARGASARSIAIFSSLTFGLTVAGVPLMMGPVYRALSMRDPMLADQLFFLVFPFAPVLLAMAVSWPTLRRNEPHDVHALAALGAAEQPPDRADVV